jgi:hypothetical protein
VFLAVLPLRAEDLPIKDQIVTELQTRVGEQERQAAETEWRQELSRRVIEAGPPSTLALNTYRTAIAQVIANRKGSALEPGPRRYATSWIRDGSVMASALLQAGHTELARSFFVWFSQFVRDSGYVPCCITVDREDPPYVEHDSHGQYLYLLTEIFRYTQDREIVKKHWPQVRRVVGYIRSLREQNLKAQFLNDPNLRPYYGLLPASVSHEGYLGNPVHAYWDDFWGVRGLEDIAWLADVIGEKTDAQNWSNLALEFRKSLLQNLFAGRPANNTGFLVLVHQCMCCAH